jgi:hypothetical protein
MQKYSFTSALDRTGEATKDWPRKEKQLTLIKTEGLKVIEIMHLKSETETLESLRALSVL